MSRTTAVSLGLLAYAGATVIEAQRPAAATLCDGLAAREQGGKDASALTGTLWSRLTTGATAPIEVATVSELSLEPNPAADERVQFEKRFRALYGNAAEVLKELRGWDNFDILALPRSAVRMLLMTRGPAECESRLFFRVTTSREVVRVPEPPASSANESDNALCEKRGGWGYFARVNGAEAFVEYRRGDHRESLRVVPLTNAGWQPSCGIDIVADPR